MENNVWTKAQSLSLQISDDVSAGFDIGFDKKIPMETQTELRSFVKWVEQNYRIPITLWVDFEYKHYLIKRNGERVGYLFYWVDFSSYPVFNCKDDIPQIRLPVRTEHSSIEEILTSFIEAITDYYAWLCNEIHDEYTPNERTVDAILEEYLKFKDKKSNDIFPIVKKHIDKMDFYGLLAGGAPGDEFDIESKLIARAIRADMSAEDITGIIADIFNSQFSTSRALSEFALAAENIKSELIP